MDVVWSDAFREVYDTDPAAAPGRLDPAVAALDGWARWVAPDPAPRASLLRCHTPGHLHRLEAAGLLPVASLAAGAALQAARLGAEGPAFALVRPPGHHASQDRAWGFCHCNNLAVALWELRATGRAGMTLVVDFDLHYGDGTVAILGHAGWVEIVNPAAPTRSAYLGQVGNALEGFTGDCLAFSAGFDNHVEDWGGLLETGDYEQIGLTAGRRARALGARCFGVLEGGYNPTSLAAGVRAFCEGLQQGWQARR